MGEEIKIMLMGIRHFLQFLGIIIFIFGLLFSLTPNLVKRLNELGKRLIFSEEGALKHNLKTGILFMVMGAIIFFLNIFLR
ncbi:MAG: hypothetical protein NC920_05790 [Candidatus Omnitrophica bacterium]|nr:hypothetical protein [Candidatus Omnitrophota bacterium]MCM8798061.1 hypothetical protein [Candidatus Omnitrophota bacterium]